MTHSEYNSKIVNTEVGIKTNDKRSDIFNYTQ